MNAVLVFTWSALPGKKRATMVKLPYTSGGFHVMWPLLQTWYLMSPQVVLAVDGSARVV
jgi:hypothetical protein